MNEYRASVSADATNTSLSKVYCRLVYSILLIRLVHGHVMLI